MARSAEAREKLLRKQVFTGLTAMLQHATRWKPELLVGSGQGGLISALAALPLVTEAACRSRVTPMAVMREYRQTWANARAIVAINPVVVPQQYDLGAVQRALPEVLRLQPASVPRQILAAKGYQHEAFAKDPGGLIAAPARSDAFDPKARGVPRTTTARPSGRWKRKRAVLRL